MRHVPQNLGKPVAVEFAFGCVGPTVSSLMLSVPWPGRAAAAADVMTTRLTPVFVAARSTRNVPSRAGPIKSLPVASRPSGEAT